MSLKNRMHQVLTKTRIGNTLLKVNRIIKVYKKGVYLRRNGEYTLRTIVKILDKNSIRYFLTFGTLLGIERNNKLIKNDTDIDIGLFLNDYNPNIIKIIIKNGGSDFKEYRYYSDKKVLLGVQQKFKFQKIDIDFYFHNINNKIISTFLFLPNSLNENKFNLIKFYFPFSGLSTKKYKNYEITLPKNSNLFLQHHYGNDYLIPNPYWSFIKDTTNKEIFKDCKVIIQFYS